MAAKIIVHSCILGILTNRLSSLTKPINIDLDLLRYKDRLVSKMEDNVAYLKDPIRKKWIQLTPEEFVRQLTLEYLMDLPALSKRLLSVEKQIKVNGIIKRFDILLYDDQAEPLLLVECKAPQVKLTDETFKQISFYNLKLKVPFLLITNGKDAYFCRIDLETKSYHFMPEVVLE